MERWNPKSYLKEGLDRGYQKEYLGKLIEKGHQISRYKIPRYKIPVIFSLAHLASLSQTLYKDLHYFVSRTDHEDQSLFYKSFTIQKHTGGKRWISIPCPQLMAVQDFIAKEILNLIPPHSAATAYVYGLKDPLTTNAIKHVHSDWLLKMDIKNFFSNISERQVYDVFYEIGYPPLLSFEMARLCTRVTPKRKGARWNVNRATNEQGIYTCTKIGSLPQGAPTSPALSNLMCRSLDVALETLADSHKAAYSRYADDLCFSFMKKRHDIVAFKKEATKILHTHSFSENRKKTRIIHPGARKIITGVVINSGKPTIPREFRDKIRMHLFYANKVGIPEHCRRRNFRSVLGFKNHLYGLIMHVRSINLVQGEALKNQFNQLPWLNFEL